MIATDSEHIKVHVKTLGNDINHKNFLTELALVEKGRVNKTIRHYKRTKEHSSVELF